MLLAQEITVEVASDPLSLVVSAIAVAVATGSLVFTFIQGRTIQAIEVREHVWQIQDRMSAHIEVVRMSEAVPRESFGSITYSHRSWIRMRNTGLVEGRGITWRLEGGDGELEGVFHGDELRELDVLYPGEHYDLYLALSLGDPVVGKFLVSWTDQGGAHMTKRLLNL